VVEIVGAGVCPQQAFLGRSSLMDLAPSTRDVTSAGATTAEERNDRPGTLQSAGTTARDGTIRELAPWFHNLHLPHGEQTAPDHPLGDFPAFKWRHIGGALSPDLTGCRALDVGCNAGFYTFELARRGADVLAIDHDPHYLRQAEWARSQYDVAGSIEFRQMGVYDLPQLR